MDSYLAPARSMPAFVYPRHEVSTAVPISWQDDVLFRFFRSVPEPSNFEEQKDRISLLDYVGKHLRYSMWLLRYEELVMISGDQTHPFGADSLFEIAGE